MAEFSVVLQPNPFASHLERFTLEAGSSINEVLCEVVWRYHLDPAMLRTAAIIVGDRKIPKDMWATTRPKACAEVVVKVMPADDFGSLLVTVVGLVAAFYVPGGIALFGIKGLGTALIRAGISLATTLVAQAIAPGPRRALSGGADAPPDARYTITGVRNELRPYDVVPQIFGRLVKYYPPQGTLPYTEIASGDNQHLRALFVLGDGRIQATAPAIGDMPLSNFKSASYEFRAGTASDASLTLFPRQVREEGLSIQLRSVNGFSERRSPIDTTEIQVDVSFPGGMGRITDRNIKFGIVVRFEVQYKLATNAAWSAAPLAGSSSGGLSFEGNGVFNIAGYTKNAVRRSVWFSVPRGQYDVRVRRITIDDQSDNTGKNQSTTFEDSYWTAVRWFEGEAPIRRTQLAMFALRVQATDQLNGVIDQFNCTVQRWLPVWDGSTWTTRATRNPAWAFVEVLVGRASDRPLALTRLNLAEIKAWADYCDAKGYTFDAVINFETTVWDLIQDIAATGRASPTLKDGLWTVVWDYAQTVPVQMFSDRNTRNLSITKTFLDLPHGVNVYFPNVATQHQVDIRAVYADGYSAANATRMDRIDLAYTTDAAIAWKMGRYYLAAQRLRPEVFSFETGIEQIRCTRRDLVKHQSGIAMHGGTPSRIKSVVLDESDNCTGIVLDAPVPMAAGKRYGARIWLGNGESVRHEVTTVAGEQASLTFVTPIPAADPQPVGEPDFEHVIVGELDRETVDLIIRSIEPRADRSALITAVAAAPEIDDADSGPIPAHDPQIQLPPIRTKKAPPKPAVLSYVSDETVLVAAAGGALQSRILVRFEVRQREDQLAAEFVQVRYRAKDIEPDWSMLPALPVSATEISLMPVEDGWRYEFELRTVSQLGLASEWTHNETVVVGKTTPPPDIERLYRNGQELTWPYPDPPPDLAGFEFRVNNGTSQEWATGRPLHTGLLSASPLRLEGLSGTVTVMGRAIDTSGNYSVNAASVTLGLGDPVVANVVETQSEAPDWAGVLSGGSDTGTQIEADLLSSPPFWGPDSLKFWGADGDLFWQTDVYEAMTYTAAYTPISDVLGDGVLQLDLEVTGDFTVDYRIATTGAFWGADGDPFWGSDGDAFWAADTFTEWTSFPGKLGPLTTTAETYEFRLNVAGGATQGVCSKFDIIVDVPDLEESFEDLEITNAAAGLRIPITKTYRRIKTVALTRQDDGGDAVDVFVVDKDETLGPLVKARNAAGSLTTAVFDVDRLQGY